MKIVYCILAAILGLSLFALPRPSSATFDKGALFTVAGYAGSSPLSGFPVLVRIKANSPVGFFYADLHSQSDGADIAFVDTEGKGLPFEIDTWDPTGTSLIWVKLSTMTNRTQFVMCWGSAASGKTVCNESPFAGYVGVWHMSEASGTVADSSGNGLTATPAGDAAASSIAAAGPVGNGRKCITDGYLSIADANALDVGDAFAVSGWFNMSSGQPSGDVRFFSRKVRYQTTNDGWEIIRKSNNIAARGKTGDNIAAYAATFAGAGWKHLFVVYNGNTATIYENGVEKKNTTAGAAPEDNNNSFSIGSYSGGGSSYFVGNVDECRLLDAVPSADWAKAEYDSMNDSAFLTADEAELYGTSSFPVVGILISPIGYTNAMVVVSISDFGTGALSADVVVKLSATSDLASPLWTESYSATTTGARSFDVSGLLTNTTYFVGVALENNKGVAAEFGPLSFTTHVPSEPSAAASVSGRTAYSLSASVDISSIGDGSLSASVLLEASIDGFDSIASSCEVEVLSGGNIQLEVGGLSAFTTYGLRVRILNEWGLSSVVDLGHSTTLPASGLAELYVDSLGSGSGSSPDSALPTIREALDMADAGYTIWVRGGEGRAYGVTNETDTLPIPAGLDGLSIRAYTDTPGDGGLALVQISDTYIDSGNRAHIISNRAANVTVSGLDFAFGTHAIGRQEIGSCSILWTAAPFTTLENCLLRMPEPTTYAGSGAGSPLVICTSKEATNLVVRGCEFRNTRCWSDAHGYAPIKCKSNALIVGNIFTNVNATATAEQRDAVNGGEQSCYNFSFVSNVVYGANDGGNLSAALLYGLYPGPKSAEIAFNRFVADSDARNMQGGIVSHRVNLTFGGQFAEAFSGKEATLIHHNTIIGGRSAFLFNDAQDKRRKNQFFNNLILLDPNCTNLVENVSTNATEFAGGRTTSFISPSCLRNNAYTGVLTGGSATRLATYDLEAGLEITNNIVISSPLEFICTNDIYSADFYRVRCHPGDPDLKRLGWRGPDGVQPRFIGALEPVVPGSFTIHLR